MKYLISTLRRFIYSAWIGLFAMVLMAFHLVVYADQSELLTGQILHIACNGDVTDQSDLQHPVENNGATFVSDRLGKRERACFFDGSDYLKIPKNAAFNLSNFTIAAYVLVEGTYNGEARAIVSNYDKYPESAAGTYQHYGIGMATAGAASVFYDDGTGLGGAKDVGSSLADGQWHHVAAVFQGGVNVKLYVDGVLKRQSSGVMPTMISPTGDLFIGRGGSSELIEKKWIGSLDEVRILNRALLADEVNQLAGIIDLPTGETFTPLGPGDNDPFLLETKEGPVPSVMVTPNPEGGFSLNTTPPADVTGLREGERGIPSETSTLVINDGEVTLLDEAQPGVVATLNIFGDLEVTDANIPDLKLILPRNSDQFAFLSPSNPSVVARVNHDGTLEIVDETNPNVLATYNHKDGSYMVVDNEANTVTLIDRNGDAVLSHPDAPGIAATFNIFDSEGNYSIVDTVTNECVEMIANRGLRFSLLKNIAGAIGSGVKSATTVASNAAQSLISKVTSSAGTLASTAATAVGSLGKWFACLPAIGKFALVGGAIAVVGGVVAAVIGFKKMKKKIKNLEGQIQTLQATVQQQAETIRRLEETVANQAQTIQRLETTIEQLKQIIIQQAQVIQQQAEEIAALRDTVEQQKEIIAKQAEMIAALEKRIADLEARTTRSKDGVDQIPDGQPTIRKVSGVRRSEPTECIQVPQIPLIALQTVAANRVNNKVVVKWQTLAELANVGFNLYRATKDTAGQFTDITKINDMLIPTQGNGVEEHTYVYEDYPPRVDQTYYYAIESVDTDGKPFLFDNRVVEAQVPALAILGDFIAIPASHNLLLQWKTIAEMDSNGFNLWRAKVPADGQCENKPVEEYQEVTKLTDQLVPAKGSLSQGGSYSYEDGQTLPQTTYCYGLEEIGKDGTSFFYWDWVVTATAR